MDQPKKMTNDYPSFENLPIRQGDPPFSAWSLWGENDELGTLNWLSPQVVRNASLEIQTGKRFGLSLPLHKPRSPGFGRHECEYSHRVFQPGPVLALDDSLVFNTQRSSQWDGLRHFAYQKEKLFYMGTKLEDILQEGDGRLGLQNIHAAGGIAGRGILLDYWSYAESHNKSYDANQSVPITFDDLMACLKYQSEQAEREIVPRPGDILLIRSGVSHCSLQLDEQQEKDIFTRLPPSTCGVQQDVRMLQWLWKEKIAAVGGDAPAWECFPPEASAGFMYHEVLIAGWGCPISEYLWLEDLAKFCKEEKRWTMFLSSCPLNVHGGVGSTANLMAIL